MTSLGEPNVTAIAFFIVFIALSLGITVWASRKTRTTDQFYAAGRSVTAFQNGLALAGDYMSAASFLGIVGLVATSGFDGLLYSIGFLVGWPVVMFLIAEPLRNLGRYTFADVLAARLRARRRSASLRRSAPWRSITFYLIAQMVGAGNLIRLLFGLPVRVRRRHRRRRDARLRAVRRDDRDDVGADRQGRAAAGRRDDAGDPRAGAVRDESAGALRAGASAVRRQRAEPGAPRHGSRSTRCRSGWR